MMNEKEPQRLRIIAQYSPHCYSVVRYWRVVYSHVGLRKEKAMVKVKTFGSQFQIFHITQELNDLDAKVNDFLAENKVKKVISVSDATTSNVDGATMGIIRVLTYKE